MPEDAGLLLVDKPEGPTSHDQVALARRTLGIKRIGHTGTLDPFASGLLLLCIGWATRLVEYTASLTKTYQATARLGASTSTDDRTGETIASSEAWRDLSENRVQAALQELVGELEQRPPVFSAKKVGGERAYELARRGDEPELGTQRVTVHRIEMAELSLPRVEFEIECSSGTYVRAVARDLGERLSVGGHLESLRRTAIGSFRVENAVTLAPDIRRSQLEPAILPPEAAVAHLPRVELGPEARRPLSHGQPLAWSSEGAGESVAVFVGSELKAIAEVRDGKLWPRKVLTR